MGLFTPLTAIPRLLLAKKQQKAADAIKPQDFTSTDDPMLQEELASARLQANSGMAGSGAFRRSIFGNQANTNAAARRNSTSGAQAIAVAAATQGSTNAALSNLQTAEQQDAVRKQGILTGTLDKFGSLANNDRLRKYMTARQDKTQLQEAALKNKFRTLDDFDETLATVAGMASGGGVK